ncbi:phosphatidylinositol-glycan-specific phospholipase D-like isoform X2 [Ostrea edulis]|uniref:phosphatidylinositol-glycan-specific phospholipase D-like isoform X2 n=1 Tax=Ostrea edulis TaxID=37623 RepID=UPI002095608A|nr:phosphatidylinositol-glycan-specific phospholipase D-like isoform X2 [Ostrea edulis]
MRFYVPLLSLVLLFHEARGAGIVTQITVAQRAVRYFNPEPGKNYSKILNHESSSFYSGTSYPDAYYNELCEFGIFSNISDDTKTGAFLNATINYINKQPKPWNKTTERMFSFMMGMMSNLVSDPLWTSQGVDQGFLSSMGYTNFHGSVHEARKAGNFGGDIVVVYLLSLVDLDDWYIPVDDLYEIYKEFYGSVQIDKSLIESCSTLALVTAYAELTGNAELFTTVADTSDFLVDNVIDYFQGGIMDMSVWTHRKWHDAITMLENGTQSCHIPHNPLFINCTKKQDSTLSFHPKTQRPTNRPYTAGLTVSDLQIEREERGITIRPGKKLKNKIEELKARLTNLKEGQHNTGKLGDDYHWKVYFEDYSGSLLGKALAAADIDGDGNVDVTIGAPGFSQEENIMAGRVYVLYSGVNGFQRLHKYDEYIDINNLTLGFNRIFDGEEKKQSRFGSSLALLDVNLDGMLDLAIGASSYGNTNPLDYNGRIFIYFGTGKDRKWNQKPDITLTCESKFCTLGYSLAAVDVNKDGRPDLVMSSPHYSLGNLTQNGMVAVLISKSTGSGTTIPVESLTRKIYGDQSYSWFGHRISGKKGVLLVNQPYFRICEEPTCPSFSKTDKQAVGKLHVYNFGDTLMTNMSIAGRDAFDLAGHSSDFGDPFGNGSLVIAVGVPGADVEGEIFTLLNKLTQAGKVILLKLLNGQLTEIATYESDRRYSRFGSRVSFVDINDDEIDDLLIGSPYRNDDPSNLFSIEFDGKTYAFYGGQNFTVGNATKRHCNRISPCPDRNANHTFAAYYNDKNYFGDNFVTLPCANVTQLVISASICADSFDDYGTLSSFVYVFDTGRKSGEV